MPDEKVTHDDVFSIIVETRNVELTTLWTRFNIHLLVNGGYLVALLTADDKPLLRSIGRAPYLFGLVFACLWFLSELFGRLSLNHRDKSIADFEKNFWCGSSLKSYSFFKEIPKCLYGQMFISFAFIVMVIVAWVFLLLR